jgi:hypothetical protein
MADDVFRTSELQGGNPVDDEPILPAGDLAGDDEDAPSLEDTLHDTYRAIEDDEAATARGETPPPRDGRPREPDGKFAKGQQLQTAKPQQQPDAQAAPQAQPNVPADSTKAPASWKPQFRARWNELSPDIQAEIHRREADQQRGALALKADADIGRVFASAVQPFRPIMDALGVPAPAAVNEVLRTAAVFYIGNPAQKLAVLQGLARLHGINPAALGTQSAPQAAMALPPEIQAAMNRLAKVEGTLNASHRQAELSELRKAESEIESFASDAENYPYFADVRVAMGRWIDQQPQEFFQLPAKDQMHNAYMAACYGNPDIRAAMELATSQKADQQRRQRVQNAQRIGGIAHRGTAPAAPVGPGKGTMDDTLHAAYRALQGNG